MAEQNSMTLSALNGLIREALEQSFLSAVWVVAEINELQINRSGHCYLDLIEKDASGERIVAKSRATIWSSRFGMVRSYFETATGTMLQAGIKVMVKATVSFHEVYGISLNITDIDPSYTMGEQARRRLEVLRKLKASGVMEMNRELPMPLVPRRIAVISSETAAGYGDFMGTLTGNIHGFGFSVVLFPALVQGEAAEASIIAALEQVYGHEGAFDVVAIIRGGGSQADLDCFNGYELAMNIAQFPLPVLTGIGHERDETIADMVAHRSLKTPTAVAEFIIDRVMAFAERLDRLQEQFARSVRQVIHQEQLQQRHLATELQHLTRQFVSTEKHALAAMQTAVATASARTTREAQVELQAFTRQLVYGWRGTRDQHHRKLESLQEKHERAVKNRLQHEKEALTHLAYSIELLRPEKVLARGYSITYADGKIVKSVGEIGKGTLLETRMADGRVESVVSKIEKRKNNK